MADKDKLPKPSEQKPPMRPIHEAEERELKSKSTPPPKEKREK